MASTEVCWDQLSQLFPSILQLWKEAPTHNNWAMEKLMELFCKQIATDPALVQSVGFPSFLKGFFQSGQLIQYPDFVLNNVALMAGEVILAKSSELHSMEEAAFRLIRHPLEYWLVDKGHSAHVTFQLYSKFVQHEVMLQNLDKFSFDVSHALAYATASPHNYTRKSASMYLTDLIKFAFQKSGQVTDLKAKLRTVITESLNLLMSSLNQQQCRDNDQSKGDRPLPSLRKHAVDADAKIRYCQLVCNPAKTCPEWFKVIISQGIFSGVLELCCQIVQAESEDGEGLYLTCAQMLEQLLLCCKEQEVWEKHYQLLWHLIKTLCQQGSASNVTEIMRMAQTVLQGQGDMKLDDIDKILLMELSLLPLFVLVSAVPHGVHKFSPEIVSKVQTVLVNSSTSNPMPMMKEAVKNLYSVLDGQIIYDHQHAELLQYLSFQVSAPPSQAIKPLIYGKQLRDDQVVIFLEYSLPHLQYFKSEDGSFVENILTVIESFMKYPRLTHVHIQVAMECASNVVTNLGIMNQEVLLSLLQILQLKMVDLSPTIQEAAVKAAGDLLLSGGLDIAAPGVAQCANALWQCVNYQSEGVATQVIQVLTCAFQAKILDDFLSLISTTEAEVTHKMEKFVISSSWDSIKPKAFKLLSLLCTKEIVLKYAQASFKRYNAELRVSVIDYMKSIFEESYTTRSSVEGQIQDVMTLLSTGWGDLLLDKSLTVETWNFRQATSIMEGLLSFMDREDVREHFDSTVSDLAGDKQPSIDNSKGLTVFSHICDTLMHVHGHVDIEQNGTSTNGHLNSNKELLRNNLSDEGTPAKKMKYEAGVSKLTENNSQVQNTITQALFNSVLSGTLIDKNAFCKFSLHMCLEEDPITGEHNILDCTKELPPLALRSDPVPSRKLILDSLSTESCEDVEKVIKIISWLVHKEILHRVQPANLSTEAERSTDEYERNCTMLLYDFHLLLNKSYRDMKEDLEGELTSFFLTRFSDILYQNEQVKQTVDETVRLQSLFSFLQQVDVVLNNEDQFCELVFSHRKSVLVEPTPIDISKFVVDIFLDKLDALQCQDVKLILCKDKYPAQEGVSLLLDMFCHEQKKSTRLSRNEDSIGTQINMACVSSQSDKPENQPSLDKVTQLMRNECKQFKTSGSIILAKISIEDHETLCTIINEHFEWKIPEDALKQILLGDKRKSFHSILHFMKLLCKQLVLGIFDDDPDVKSSVNKEPVILFEQIQSWLLSEREFDSDDENDPTALDCF